MPSKFIPPYLGTPDDLSTETTQAAILAKLDVPLSDVRDAVNDGLTDTELRASPVPISAASLPLPTGASTEATLALIKAKTDNIDVALSTRTKPADAQHAIIDSGTVTNVAQQGGVAISLNTGVRDTGTQRVTIATNDLVPVSVSSLPTTPAGTAIIGKVGIDQTTDGVTNAVHLVNGSADDTNNVIATVIKPISSATYSPSVYQNLGADNAKNIKASAGNVFSLACYNANGATGFIQLFNTTTDPTNGQTPTVSFAILTGQQIVVGKDFFTDPGIRFPTGISFGFSSTPNLLTLGTAGDQTTVVTYK